MGNGHLRDAGSALKQHWINVLVHWSVAYVEWADPDIVCVIGQGTLSRPIVCLRCRAPSLRIFSPGDANCHKIDNGNPNNLANTEIYAYLETSLLGLPQAYPDDIARL